ncbi:hypothetical protein OG866_26745 [Streptomyces sp. NBC_00663]|uniref:hypothetical protein n=1 Tax=Streptomyces sp. NBC_00663 TaxID=2975801 RepID=UPI002E2FF9CF|nr:hypothetical protein [Streptomyces sp. NBC_00663]
MKKKRKKKRKEKKEKTQRTACGRHALGVFRREAVGESGGKADRSGGERRIRLITADIRGR